MKQLIDSFAFINSPISNLTLPATWQQVFEADNHTTRVRRMIAAWSENYQDRLSKLIGVFERFLKDVRLIDVKGDLAVLYELEVEGERRYYISKNPLQKVIPATIAPFWNKLPSDFRAFYDQLHNGWYELESEAIGPAAVEDFQVLSNFECGILEEIKIPFSSGKVISVFSNAAGGYLCWNFNQAGPEGLVWWHDDAPDVEVDFWDVLDEWITMGIDEE